MSGRDTSNTEMLSAYLDGELSSEERHDVERKLAESNKLRQLLGQLRQLSDDLQRLPRYHLATPVYDRILSEIERLAQDSVTEDEPPPFSDELISAYLDGELSDAERACVEGQLEESTEHRQLLGELRDLRDTLNTLPVYQLDDGFADRVVRRAERETLLGSVVDDVSVTTTTKPASVAKRSRWRVYAWVAVTVAAVVALVFSIPRGGNDAGTNLAGPGPNTETQDVRPHLRDSIPQKDSRALVDIDPRVDVDSHDTSPKSQIDTEAYAQWELVNFLQRKCPQRLILVYQLAVTPEGVENAALANLLRLHRIRFRQTVEVKPKQQKSLLKQQFFQGVQVASGKNDNMDEIQLYLVSCTARDAAAMWHYLMGRPNGIGSFYMNLTTAEAEDRVLHHLCEASGVLKETGQAVQLLANFGILSRSARNLGAFGKIGWIEPSLLNPSLAPRRDRTGDNVPEKLEDDPVGSDLSSEQALAGDFPCELLFVVRNLKPLDGEAEGESDDETKQGE